VEFRELLDTYRRILADIIVYILKIEIYPRNKKYILTRKSIQHLVNVRGLKEKGWKPVLMMLSKRTTFTDVCMAGW